ncbi:hypothetical protein [Candidatus Vondammii sp. HM_W22]|uniref:hypothetical protein n=1 Tax=Candidatus Vondammii sp. HM_W22 TaxID=2687299 RepID=UPI00403D7116
MEALEAKQGFWKVPKLKTRGALYNSRAMGKFVSIDLDMHKIRKGKWYLGMKADIGMDSRTKLIRSISEKLQFFRPSWMSIGF